MPNVMELTSNALRGLIIAPPNHKLVVADLSNIEGRVQAWLAGEDWKLAAFRDYDAGIGPDLYKLAYALSFRIHHRDVNDKQRQIGKVQELALGYEGGVGAWVTFAAGYNIDLDALTEQIIDFIPRDVWDEACGFLEWVKKEKRSTFGLTDDVFRVCDSLKRGWRHGHPMISKYWNELKEATIGAINRPGNTFLCRRLEIERQGNWLKIRLPSGRFLCYPSPRVENETISYMGMNQYSRKWERLKTYGGKLFENVCQAVARDVMAANMLPADDAGYSVRLTVHDELITYVPDNDDFSPEGLSTILSTCPQWAEGLPLAAAGFEGYRYKKG